MNEIMKIMDTIEYGFLDNSSNDIFKDKDVEQVFNKTYYLMSPEELLVKKKGVCWDQVELERKLFTNNSIKNKTYFIYADNHDTLPSHTFLVFYRNNKVYWFEHSWYDEKGIHEYNTLNELLLDVKEKFLRSRKDEIESTDKVHLYEYQKPKKYHFSCEEFYQYIFTQEKIY